MSLLNNRDFPTDVLDKWANFPYALLQILGGRVWRTTAMRLLFNTRLAAGEVETRLAADDIILPSRGQTPPWKDENPPRQHCQWLGPVLWSWQGVAGPLLLPYLASKKPTASRKCRRTQSPFQNVLPQVEYGPGWSVVFHSERSSFTVNCYQELV